VAQITALIVARWRMLRRPWVKALAVLAAGLAALLVVIIVVGSPSMPDGAEVELATLLGSLLLLFPVLAFMAGMAAGGGTEAIPSSQLVAFPLTPRAVFVTSIVLTPLNVAWALQAITIVGLAGYVGSRGIGLALLVSLAGAFVVATTAAGLALSWFVTAIRGTWRGRRLTEGAVALVAAALALQASRSGAESLIEALPLSEIAVALLLTPPRETATWGVSLVALTVAAVVAGGRATAWALQRRDDDTGRREGRLVRRRRWRQAELTSLLAVDWASARRSKLVRRGMVLFAIVPGLAGLASAMPWQDMVILPGLVATGSGLLFAVNSFALDGSGAVWLESTPRSALLAFISKATVAAAVTAVVVGGALLIGSLRPREAPDPRTALVLVLAAICAVLVSTAVAMRASLRHPTKADLRTARDTPAPPAAMTLHSVRLIATTTAVGIAFVVTVRLSSIWPSLAITWVVATLSLAHVWRSSVLWRRPALRSRVTAAVSSG
jgi:hypothetical protein